MGVEGQALPPGVLVAGLTKSAGGGGVTVGPNDTVELIGEVDKDFNKVEFDVDIVKKVN